MRRQALGAVRWAARRLRAGRAGRVRQASVSGRGAQGVLGVQARGRAGARVRADTQAAARAAGAGMGSRGAGRERAERAAWAHGARGLGVPVRAG